jgi:CHASE3 domain sensor protein
MWDWLTDLLFLGATEDAARRSAQYRRRVERIVVAVCAVAVVLVLVAALMLLVGR